MPLDFFLAFLAFGLESSGQDPICVFGTRHSFSLGRRRPKLVSLHFVPFHSAGLWPGKTKPRQRFAVGFCFTILQLETFPILLGAKRPSPHRGFGGYRQGPYLKSWDSYLKLSQLLIGMSSMSTVQNALMNELARRALVINGIFRSMAARRILYPLVSSC